MKLIEKPKIGRLTKKSSKKRVIETWLAALESGDYKQTTKVLHRKGVGKKPDSFCCLGVLCDLAVKAKVIPVPVVTEQETQGMVYAYNGFGEILPDSVKDWAGLQREAGDFRSENGDDTCLAELNDGGKKFKTISKIIRSKPEGLFV